MLSRDSLKTLRRIALEGPDQYVCPDCSRRRFLHQFARTRRPNEHRVRIKVTDSLSHFRSFNNGRTSFQRESLASTTSPLDEASIQSSAAMFGKHGDVRGYLKNWSLEYNRSLEANRPDEVTTVGRQVVLPNSLFARSTSETQDEQDDPGIRAADVEDLDDQGGGLDEHDSAGAGTYARVVEIGDLFTINVGGIREQLAICVGQSGAQFQYLLENGRWFVHTLALHGSWRLANFVSEKELIAIRAILPQRDVETRDTYNGLPAFQRAMGEVPPAILAPFIKKFGAFQQELELCRRKYGKLLDDAYNALAHETAFATTTLAELVQKVTHRQLHELSRAEQYYLREKIDSDERFVCRVTTDEFEMRLLPQRVSTAIRDVTTWTRAYQDAAARAATGKDVFQELKDNPLTAFISKARRLIAKSRAIRSPTSSGILSPTFKHLVPESGRVERKPSGETFTEADRKIITVIWHVNVKRPMSPAIERTRAACTLILRAVGAYPDVSLGRVVGGLFLQELGCLDPWYFRDGYRVGAPDADMGLDLQAINLKAEEEKAVADLGLDDLNSSEVPFPDSMVHLRKDWGDHVTFAIDKFSTVIRDDAISVEAAEDMPGNYWLHVHIAHPSAFLPLDHVFVKRAMYMTAGLYSPGRVEPYFPRGALNCFSISNKRPTPVLTCSTLLDTVGTIKDIKVTAGLLRNVVYIDPQVLQQRLRSADQPVERKETLVVGNDKAKKFLAERATEKEAAGKETDNTQIELIEEHSDTLRLMQSLLKARWDARVSQNPTITMEYYRMINQVSVSAAELPLSDQSIDRIYRSEFCYGDPAVSIEFTTIQDENVQNHRTKHDLVASSMLLASESWSRWLSERNAPAIHRRSIVHPSYSVDKLNNLDKHEGFIVPIPSLGLKPTLMPEFGMQTAGPVQNPLRRAADLINHYQTDAILKAEAVKSSRNDATISTSVPSYPFSAPEISKFLDHYDPGIISKSGRALEAQLAQWAIFRAAYFGEGRLPSIFDATMANPVQIGQAKTRTDHVLCKLPFMGLSIVLDYSEQGFEKQAKFNQYLPVKLIAWDATVFGSLRGVAVGPPQDTPFTKSSLYDYDKKWDAIAAAFQHETSSTHKKKRTNSV